MSRVLMIGYAPLPRKGLKIFMSPGLRTYQMLRGVLEGGHGVTLYTLPMPGSEDEAEKPEVVHEQWEDLNFHRFTTHSGEFAISTLQAELPRINPDAILAVNAYPSYIASLLQTTHPLWCDLNGFWMSERQAQAALEGDDANLQTAWNIEQTIVRRLDKYSAVSRPQLHAILGELGSVGRFNKHTYGYSFGSQVPNASFEWEEDSRDFGEPVLRGPIVSANPDVFIVLWSGAFYPRCDIDLMMRAMNEIMTRSPLVHLVATGGPIRGVDDQTFAKFKALVEESPYKDRMHVLGWVPSHKMPAIYREADIGINVDGVNYESLFGGRNRMGAMLSAGLPVITTIGTEISEWLEDGDAIFPVQAGDLRSLIDALKLAIEEKASLPEYGARGREIMHRDFNIAVTTRTLRNWLKNPTNAPDNKEKIRKAGETPVNLLMVALNPLERSLLQREIPLEQVELEEEDDGVLVRQIMSEVKLKVGTAIHHVVARGRKIMEKRSQDKDSP